MARPLCRLGLAAPAAFALTILFASTPALSGGGGSNAVFSLDRTSPGLAGGFNPSDLVVDDPETGPGGSLMLALPAEGLGLTPAHNVDGLASGKENGVLAILIAVASGVPNPLDIAAARYQFSAERLAVDGVEGFVDVPFDLVPPPPIITKRADFEPQFVAMDQAADIFDNVALVDRFNFPVLPEEGLELTGTPLAPEDIDNVDAFSSLGSFGVLELDAAADGDFFPDVPVYYSTDSLTDGSGLLRGTIFVKPAGADPVVVYATPADLGLEMLDDIDGLSIWEDEFPANLVFDEGDGVVFSLRAGSPTLPVVMDDVVIDEGGIFLALPGMGIVAALPGGYFSLSAEDDLDGLHVVDPRSGFPGPCFMGPTPSTVAPFGGLMLVQSTMEMMDGGVLEIFVYLSDTERLPDMGGMTDFSVVATISDPVARFSSGTTPLTGEPNPPGCDGGCADDHPRYPPCPGMSAEFMACELIPLSGPNLCLGCLVLEPLADGEALVTVTASATGELGPIAIATAYTTFRVSGFGSTAVVETPRAARGLRVSPNPFLSSVRIDLDRNSPIPSRVLIHDVAGRLVRVLSTGARQAGSGVTWDGRDREGRSVPPGFYVVRADAGGEVRTAKVLRIR